MDFWKTVRYRRSIREFKQKPIPKELIKKIIQAASLAPSGGNQRNWHFIVIKSPHLKENLRQAVVNRIAEICLKIRSPRAEREFKSYSEYFTFFADAPIVIAAIMKPYDSLTARILERYGMGSDYGSTAGIQSVAASIENLLLAITDLGLGACWMTGPLIAKEALENILKIEKPSQLLALIPVGYPKDKNGPNSFPKSLKGIMVER